MVSASTRPPKVPPHWFVHAAWRVHRALHRLGGGRFLWTPSNKRGWGALRLTTTGRRSGQGRSVIIGYLQDGDSLVALAMNGWQQGHPAWWLNLRETPDAVVKLAGRLPQPVRAHEATGRERARLWELWRAVDPKLDGYASRRSLQTPVVVLETVDQGALPGVAAEGEAGPVSHLRCDGELFELRPDEFRGTHYTWLSGPNPGYGFSMSPTSGEDEQHREHIRDFLAMIDPRTGYIAED